MTVIDEDAARGNNASFPLVADAQEPDVIPPLSDSLTGRWARVVPVAVQRRGFCLGADPLESR